MRAAKKISFITPSYNEESCILECINQVRELHAQHFSNMKLEHIIIDNDSSDETQSIIKSAIRTNSHIKLIINERNFGIAKSPYFAMLQSDGDIVVPIVADLQTPLNIVPEMYTRWQMGYDVVIAQRTNHSTQGWRKVSQKIYYKILNKFSEYQQIPNFIGYGIFDRKVIDTLRKLKDQNPYFRGMISEIGYKYAIVKYFEPNRFKGKSKQSFKDKFGLATNGLISSSTNPIIWISYIGILGSGLSILMMMIFFVAKIIWWNSFQTGLIPLALVITLASSIQLFVLGIIGVYIEHIFKNIKNRPLVFVKEWVNFEKD